MLLRGIFFLSSCYVVWGSKVDCHLDTCLLCGFRVVPIDYVPPVTVSPPITEAPPIPSNKTILYCTGGITGKTQFLPTSVIYRDIGRTLPNCEQTCLEDEECEAFARNDDGECLEAKVFYVPRSLGALDGRSFLKVKGHCTQIPPLGRMRRWSVGSDHWWGIAKPRPNANDERHVVHYCYAKTKGDGNKCKLVPLTRSQDGRLLGLNRQVQIGYVSKTYGECGATQVVQWRSSGRDDMFVVKNVAEPDVNKNYKNIKNPELFYAWPDYNGMNCRNP